MACGRFQICHPLHPDTDKRQGLGLTLLTTCCWAWEVGNEAVNMSRILVKKSDVQKRTQKPAKDWAYGHGVPLDWVLRGTWEDTNWTETHDKEMPLRIPCRKLEQRSRANSKPVRPEWSWGRGKLRGRTDHPCKSCTSINFHFSMRKSEEQDCWAHLRYSQTSIYASSKSTNSTNYQPKLFLDKTLHLHGICHNSLNNVV